MKGLFPSFFLSFKRFTLHQLQLRPICKAGKMKLLSFTFKQTIFCWGFKNNCLWLLNYDLTVAHSGKRRGGVGCAMEMLPHRREKQKC